MKKVFAAFAALALVCSAAVAEVDLSGMSYDDLVALKNQINLAIWNSEEWQEVEVPQGIWKVGEDIPEGKWTIRCADVSRSSFMLRVCDFMWGEKLTENGLNIAGSGLFGIAKVFNQAHKEYEDGLLTEYTWDAKDGQYIKINDAYAPALFTPYSGKPELKFKK